jgi:hypothetical protein
MVKENICIYLMIFVLDNLKSSKYNCIKLIINKTSKIEGKVKRENQSIKYCLNIICYLNTYLRILHKKGENQNLRLKTLY